jgi:hypothetical protein
VNLLKRVSHAFSLKRGSFEDDLVPANDTKKGTISRLGFSAKDNDSVRGREVEICRN